MIIGIDASRPNEVKKTGTEWYAYHLIQHIKKLDRKNRFRLYTFDSLRDGLENLPPNFESRILRSFTDILWTQTRLSLEMVTDPPDVLFVPAHTIPLLHPKVTVLTVHDLGFEYFPDLYKSTPIGPRNPGVKGVLEIAARVATLGRYGNNELDYHRWAMRYGVKHATRIIAISEFTKNDVVKRFGADPSKITVVHHAFDPDLYRPVRSGEKPKSSRVREMGRYILFVSRIERKKNVGGLLEAYRLLRKEKGEKPKLVLIGKPALGFEEFQEQVKKFPPEVSKDIHFLGWLPEDETAEFYRFAEIVTLPSFFEGFGIGVAQAMASGVPVVCSETTSLPEVAGNAALLVNPNKPYEIAVAFSRILHSPSLKDSLISKGKKQASKFSWDKSAEKTLQVLYEAYESRTRS
jgi:glycosyltransferase involved in cell wall biosynthesis